jgi:hypothetical protein
VIFRRGAFHADRRFDTSVSFVGGGLAHRSHFVSTPKRFSGFTFSGFDDFGWRSALILGTLKNNLPFSPKASFSVGQHFLFASEIHFGLLLPSYAILQNQLS